MSKWAHSKVRSVALGAFACAATAAVYGHRVSRLPVAGASQRQCVFRCTARYYVRAHRARYKACIVLVLTPAKMRLAPA